MKTSAPTTVNHSAPRNRTVRLATAALLAVIASAASAQYFSPEFTEAQRKYDLRHYYLYPYHYSYGPRYDPYWSYNASYYPEHYYGDGSYYGMGYSGYAGDGWYGSYYYW